jgi:hypothetical protein
VHEFSICFLAILFKLSFKRHESSSSVFVSKCVHRFAGVYVYFNYTGNLT